MLSVREAPTHSLSATLEIFVLLVERGKVRAEWRSVWRDSGGLCVTVGGAKGRHWWCAGRVDLEKEVRMCLFAQLHEMNKWELPNFVYLAITLQCMQ